jgi:hypothetical protein
MGAFVKSVLLTAPGTSYHCARTILIEIHVANRVEDRRTALGQNIRHSRHLKEATFGFPACPPFPSARGNRSGIGSED